MNWLTFSSVIFGAGAFLGVFAPFVLLRRMRLLLPLMLLAMALLYSGWISHPARSLDAVPWAELLQTELEHALRDCPTAVSVGFISSYPVDAAPSQGFVVGLIGECRAARLHNPGPFRPVVDETEMHRLPAHASANTDRTLRL